MFIVTMSEYQVEPHICIEKIKGVQDAGVILFEG
jgi:hypothetical protein